MKPKESTTLNIRISKELEKKILKDVDNGSFTDTKTSVVTRILEKHYKLKKC